VERIRGFNRRGGGVGSSLMRADTSKVSDSVKPKRFARGRNQPS
jgi:hypothetical protein